MAAGRVPRLGVEHEVVVGELDRARTRQRASVSLTATSSSPTRTVLVVEAHPRVGDGGERVGVVHEVGRVRARVASLHAATARSSGGSSGDRPTPRPRSSRPPRRSHAVRLVSASPTTATTVVGASGGRAHRAPVLRTGGGRRRAGAQLLEVDLDALDAAALREHRGLGLDAGGDEHPAASVRGWGRGRGAPGSAAAARRRRSRRRASPRHDRARPRRRGTGGRRARCRSGTRAARAAGRRAARPTRLAISSWSSASTPSLSQPGVVAEVDRVVVQRSRGARW